MALNINIQSSEILMVGGFSCLIAGLTVVGWTTLSLGFLGCFCKFAIEFQKQQEQQRSYTDIEEGFKAILTSLKTYSTQKVKDVDYSKLN